jgi:hypothetical protein
VGNRRCDSVRTGTVLVLNCTRQSTLAESIWKHCWHGRCALLGTALYQRCAALHCRPLLTNEPLQLTLHVVCCSLYTHTARGPRCRHSCMGTLHRTS